MTAIKYINNAGKDIPPIIINSGVNHLAKWFNNDIYDNTLFAISKTGYSNDELSLEWLKHFDRESAKTQLGVWRLLLMDGYGAHETFEFITYCNQHKIMPFRMPPHTTHLLQSLDVVVFQPYKH